MPDGLRASVGSAVELWDGTDSNEWTTNRSWFPFLNCPSTICAVPCVAGSTPARSAIHLSVDGGLRCTRYAPPPAARTWSPPAPCATSAGKPRTSAARAAAIHTPRQPTGSHGPVCWRGIRDASAQATDMTDAAGTMACAAPPAPSPTIGRLNASSSSKPDWTQTIRHACAACASVATTARPRERNLQASTVEAFADSSHLLHACGTSSQADDVRRALQA